MMVRSRQISVAVLVAVLLVGCAGQDRADPLPHDASSRSLPIDLPRVASVLPDAFEAMHWGRLNVLEEPDLVTAEALTQDDRPVKVRATPAESGIDVSVRVGYFGDRRMQQAFLDALAEEIRK